MECRQKIVECVQIARLWAGVSLFPCKSYELLIVE